MNEFTKEELENIADALDRYEWPLPYIEEKVNKMIDNYCDHIWVFRLVHPYGQYPEQVASKMVCQICGIKDNRYTCKFNCK